VELPLRCIAAGCPPGGVVLDPFSGIGTTGLAARQLGRKYIGIDVNPAFHDIAASRAAVLQPVHHPTGHDTPGRSSDPRDRFEGGQAGHPPPSHDDRRDRPLAADPPAGAPSCGQAERTVRAA
jgi:hypothetical protein